MELYQIRYFLAVCEYGSFSRAAEACDVSQPAMTAAIKKLEAEVGSPLLHREGKRVLVTELGCRLRPHFEQVVGETRRAEDVARNFSLLRQAPLRIGTMPTIGPMRFAQFFKGFRARHEGIEVALHEAPQAELLHDLEAAEIDVAVLSAPGGITDAFRSEMLYRESYVVAFPAGHPFERLAQVALADTSGHAYLDRLACELREAVRSICSERKIELYAAYRSDREDWVQSMVLAGLGFAFLPEHSVTLPGVLCRPLVDPQVDRDIVIAEVRGRQRSPATQLLFEALHAYPWTRAASAPLRPAGTRQAAKV